MQFLNNQETQSHQIVIEKKPRVTDQDADFAFDGDLTLTNWDHFAEGVIRAAGVRRETMEMPSASSTADGFQLATISAEQATRLVQNSLVYANRGPLEGLYKVDASPSASTTPSVLDVTAIDGSIISGDALAAGGTDMHYISAVGYQVPGATSITATWDANNEELTLNSTGLGTLLDSMGLTLGQAFWIGRYEQGRSSATEANEGMIVEGFTEVTSGVPLPDGITGVGKVRICGMDADNIVCKGVARGLRSNFINPTTPLTLDFAEFYRNTDTNHADYRNNTYQIEAEHPNLGTAAPTPANPTPTRTSAYRYGEAQAINTTTLNLPPQALASINAAFIGRSVVTTRTKRTWSDNSIPEIYEAAVFNFFRRCPENCWIRCRYSG